LKLAGIPRKKTPIFPPMSENASKCCDIYNNLMVFTPNRQKKRQWRISTEIILINMEESIIQDNPKMRLENNLQN